MNDIFIWPPLYVVLSAGKQILNIPHSSCIYIYCKAKTEKDHNNIITYVCRTASNVCVCVFAQVNEPQSIADTFMCRVIYKTYIGVEINREKKTS